MSADSDLEARILEDVEHETGLRFKHIGGINSRSQDVAQAVLPVLYKWVPLLDQPNFRHAIYACFDTPFAYSYLDKLIEWWQKETYELALGTLTVLLARLAKPADGPRLWKLCQELPLRPFHYMLLSKLATFPTTEREVKEVLVKAMMKDGSLTVGDLEFISKVDDPRIRKWFEGQVNSENRRLKAIARRVVARGKKLPRQVEQSITGPDRLLELFSTEVDLEEVRPLLDKIGRELDLKVPTPIRQLRFLSSLDIDQWVRARLLSVSQDQICLWFRLEDTDTVEVVVTKDTAAPSSAQ